MADETLGPDSLAGRIRMYREAAGVSLSQLARDSGVSKSYLWNLENRAEHQRPSAKSLYAIAQALGTSMSELLGKKLLVESSLPAELDPVLVQFIEEAGLNEAEAATLASIQWRGDSPKTVERWRYVHQALRTSRSLDD
jgi:transcriptional regulator with XRE-family HTH domain